MIDIMDSSWNPIKNLLYQEPLLSFHEHLNNISFCPQRPNVFRVFKTPVNKVKVVILGQDPYPNINDAIGLSFVNGTNKVPASLRIIKKELENEGYTNPDIHSWEQQGVFLLNTALTVETGKAGSHLGYWEPFTQAVIKYLSYTNPCIWLLWGKKAQEFKRFIFNPYIFTDSNELYINDLPVSGNYNYILESAHPAAETYTGGKAGFYGNNHFKYVNKILYQKHQQEIIW